MAEEEQRRKLQKPTTTLTEAAALARSLYALDVGPGLKPLDSYDDRNFYVPTTTQGIFLLKIHNGVESANVAVLEAQNAVMCHLKARGFDCPVPVASVGGNDIEFVKAAIGEGGAAPRRFAVRLLTWVEGRTLNSLTATRARLLSAGAYLGRLRGALADFDHPGCHREHLWDINSTSGLTRFVSALDDADTEEGQEVLRSPRKEGWHKVGWKERPDRWNAPDSSFNWTELSETYHRLWDLDKPLLVENSPPEMNRADALNRTFSRKGKVRFVVLAHSMCAHDGKVSNACDPSKGNLTTHTHCWSQRAARAVDVARRFGEDAIVVRYEDLCLQWGPTMAAL